MTDEAPNADIEVLDGDGYPTDEGLEAIRTFTGSPRQLADLLSEAMCGYGGVGVRQIRDDFDRPMFEVHLVTGGWSGNESIVSALEGTFFWFAYWEQSKRGGAFWFHVPEGRWHAGMPEWPPARRIPPASTEEADRG